jgi:hypothetical protein
MVQAEILLSLTLAVVGAFLLIGAIRESARRASTRRASTRRESARPASARRGQGPGGVRVEPTTTTRDRPDGGAAPAASPEAALEPAPVVVIGAAPAAPALPPPWTAPDLPVRRPGNKPAPALSNGVRNSRFARYDRSGRPAAMGSPYLRVDGPAPR